MAGGAISPEDAVAYAAGLAMEHVRCFTDFGGVPEAPPEPEPEPELEDVEPVEEPVAPSELLAQLNLPIDAVGLSMRAMNSLKNSDIKSLRDLVELSTEKLFDVKNVGDKALQEIGDMLVKQGLNFAMKFEQVDGDLKIVDEGTPPVVVLSPKESG